jgi:hypothetical protein
VESQKVYYVVFNLLRADAPGWGGFMLVTPAFSSLDEARIECERLNAQYGAGTFIVSTEPGPW